MTDFLYPFIEEEEHDAAGLLTDLARSARAKAEEGDDLRSSTLATEGDTIRSAAQDMAHRFARGGTLFAFGNGGSATDATALVSLFRGPSAQLPLRARSLVAEPAVLTALGNDVGFELIFSRQLIAHARAGDIAVGFSTSGSSQDLIRAFSEARRLGLLTVGLAGFDGGRMAASSDIDHCIVVRGASVHRIQETQAAVGVVLWQQVHSILAGGSERTR